MIDFNNKALFKLKGMPIADGQKIVSELLIHGEGVIAAFNAIRDSLIFTNKRRSCPTKRENGSWSSSASVIYWRKLPARHRFRFNGKPLPHV